MPQSVTQYYAFFISEEITFKQDFNGSHFLEATGYHLHEEKDRAPIGLTREDALYLINKWNKSGNKWKYWID